MNLELTSFDSSWTLFLDRDGVINTKIDNDYIKKWEEFHFIDGVLNSMNLFSKKFHRIIIVTNQQGIGKGLFTEEALSAVHQQMKNEIERAGGRIDAIFHCPALASDHSEFRKPNIGMALAAKHKFPDIDFTKSIMVGDSISDMEFGKRAGMKTVYISASSKNKNSQSNLIDWEFNLLKNFAAQLG